MWGCWGSRSGEVQVWLDRAYRCHLLCFPWGAPEERCAWGAERAMPIAQHLGAQGGWQARVYGQYWNESPSGSSDPRFLGRTDGHGGARRSRCQGRTRRPFLRAGFPGGGGGWGGLRGLWGGATEPVHAPTWSVHLGSAPTWRWACPWACPACPRGARAAPHSKDSSRSRRPGARRPRVPVAARKLGEPRVGARVGFGAPTACAPGVRPVRPARPVCYPAHPGGSVGPSAPRTPR